MRIQLKQGRDGPPTLACVRADGTRTWGKLHQFFPIHDLTHYAVESVFGFDEAFFGLIASGWTIEAFAEPGAGARMPVQAMWAEHIVGLFDLERGTGRRLDAQEFSETLRETLQQHGLPAFRTVTDDELAQVRDFRSALSVRWSALAPGDTLEVTFPAVEAA